MSSVYLQFVYSRERDFCEDPDPDLDADMIGDGSGYNSDKENHPPPSSIELNPTKKWQKIRTDKQPVLQQLVKLNISERDFTDYLLSYVREYSDLVKFGYPYQSRSHANNVCFWNGIVTQKFDVNSQEFVPEALTTCHDSSDSDSNELFYTNESRKFNVNAQEFVPGALYSSNSNASSKSESNTESRTPDRQYGIQRVCARCKTGFLTTTTEYITQEKCFYHWGKLSPVHRGTRGYRYGCCQSLPESPGCTKAPLHVWNGVETINGLNGSYTEYVHTYRRQVFPSDSAVGVYAIDCEMSYTVAGLEATKVTVVRMDGRVVYDTFVLPKNEIIDYNTRFSGITEESLEGPNVRTLKQVQNDLRTFIFADTILIGHGLENDLRALKLIHPTIVDTSITFPHFRGPPYKLSLKSLVSIYLNRDIQGSENGHSSCEDATACMELMLYRVRKDFFERE